MFSLFGKLGFSSYDAKVSGRVGNQTVASGSGSDEDVSYGIGGPFNFGAFELRAEYEAIDISDDSFNFLSIGGVISSDLFRLGRARNGPGFQNVRTIGSGREIAAAGWIEAFAQV